MKSLKKFIAEAIEDIIRLNDVTVTYEIDPKDVLISAPALYQEQDVAAYLDSWLLEQMPTSVKLAPKFFGVNSDNITDAYFEYDKFEHLNKQMPRVNIEFDERYDVKGIKDFTLDTFKVSNLRFVVHFDRFDVSDTTEDVQTTLKSVFGATVSNNINRYPVKLYLTKNSITFEE
nr:MAG TPA: hypothetical protein [Caudoviricetes sp.]